MLRIVYMIALGIDKQSNQTLELFSLQLGKRDYCDGYGILFKCCATKATWD